MKENIKENKKDIIITVSLLLSFVLFFLIATDSRMKVVHYKIKSNKINKPVKIAHVTDLHSCYYGENQQDLVKAIDKEKPDVLVLTGDIFEEDMPHINSKKFIKAIKDKYKTYYVTGNHEFYKGDIKEVLKFLEDNDVHVLHGTRESVELNGNEVVINGVDDPNVNRIDGKGAYTKQLETLNSTTDTSKFNVFLAHRPTRIKSYAKGGYDLVLCGHSHGGQARIPFILNGIFEPDQGFFPKYVGGRYEVDGSTLVISRGLARETTRVPRVFNRPELVIIDIN